MPLATLFTIHSILVPVGIEQVNKKFSPAHAAVPLGAEILTAGPAATLTVKLCDALAPLLSTAVIVIIQVPDWKGTGVKLITLLVSAPDILILARGIKLVLLDAKLTCTLAGEV